MNLGNRFIEGCLAGVPGGGFWLPSATTPGSTAPPVTNGALPQQQQEQPRKQAAVANGATRAYEPPQLPNTVPVVEGVESLDPSMVHELLQSRGCLLVDLRGEDRAAGLIDGSVHEPAIDTVPFPTKVPALVQRWADQSLVVFTCQYSAHRAPQCAKIGRAHV